MSDYPKALVEKIASAILDNFNPPDDRHSSWWINPEVSAVAVLDALRLREVECDGSGQCRAFVHVHGCYTPHRADECDAPGEFGHIEEATRDY